MLKYVKEGALDLLAFTLPSSLIESIRQVSDDDFLSPEWGNQQRQPRLRRRHNPTSTSSRAVAPTQRHLLISKKSPRGLFSSTGSLLLQDTDTRSHDLPDSANSVSNKEPQLPYEVLTLIFQYLPASDMFSILAVNRLWRQIALMETKQIDLSECFPMDCLGLAGDEVYSDFDFVYHLFSIFPLISSLVIKDRYIRDRDLRVVTAGILAGKMAFTEVLGPAIGSEAYLEAQQAIARRRAHHQQWASSSSTGTATTTTPIKPTSTKVIRATIKEELREFSRSVATYVLIPQTRNTLRKKILERLEYNLEQKEIQEYCWMIENGIDPLTFQSSTAASLTQWRMSSSSSSSDASTSTAVPPLDAKRYPLVPMTHYRFQDCCFAKDWGAAMDINKLPMIGLAAAISGQGLVVDLEGSYGAPSKSIRTMIGFCFGAHCVISLDLNFRHTHMELEHVTELLSENPMLHRIDIVDSPAYHDLIRLPALRGLGGMMERMQELCLDLDERELEATLQRATILLQELDRDIDAEEAERAENKSQPAPQSGPTGATPALDEMLDEPVPAFLMARRRPLEDPRKPVKSLSEQLSFPEDTSAADKFRTANVLLKGVIFHGVNGLINTRDRQSGQALLHTLAWRRSYSSLAALASQSLLATTPTTDLPTPPTMKEHSTFSLFSSSPSSSSFSTKGYFSSQGPGFFSTSAPSSTLSEASTNTLVSPVASEAVPITEENTISFTSESPTFAPASTTPPSSSGLSSLISISALPAALSSALSFRRMSLPVSTLWIPEDSEDIGVGGGTQPEPDSDDDDDDEDKGDSGVDMSKASRSSSRLGSEDQESDSDKDVAKELPPAASRVLVIPDQHPVAILLRMARMLLRLKANPNVYNKDGRSAVVCASFMGFQPMETLLIEQGGYSKELIRIRETM
ncbi:hypothetical protein BGX33_008980 [Mortierella sp. NVP41]|nr:hypothetical protein BGX33_008980 [Mortierella sp. NVP41]